MEARSRALRVFAGERLRRKKPLGRGPRCRRRLGIPQQRLAVRDVSARFGALPFRFSLIFPTVLNGWKAVRWEPVFYVLELSDSSP